MQPPGFRVFSRFHSCGGDQPAVFFPEGFMIRTTEEGPVVILTLEGPDPLHTLTRDLILRLTEEIQRLSEKPAVRVMILTGKGDRAFIGGVNVKAMMDLNPGGAERFIADLHRCFLAIRQSEQVVIAAINGYALGAGLEMAASCDLRIASDRARFGMPEVKVGIPSVIEAAYLPRILGLGRAAELLYLGEIIDAQEAWRWGLVNRVVAPQELQKIAREMAAQILRNGPTAIVLQKKLIAQWMELPLSASIQAGIQAFRNCYQTDEPREGMKAFLDKRPPSFSQKIERAE
jgi:enoyl-CoA hydratase